MDVTIILMYQSSLFTAAQVSSIFKSMKKVRVKAAIWLHLLLGRFRQNTLKLGVYAEFPLPRTAPLLVPRVSFAAACTNFGVYSRKRPNCTIMKCERLKCNICENSLTSN